MKIDHEPQSMWEAAPEQLQDLQVRGDIMPLYQDLLEGLPCIVFEADAQTLQFTYVSSEAEEVLGYPLKRWHEDPNFWLEQVVHLADRQAVIEAVREFVQAERGGEIRYRVVRADGEMIWLRSMMRPVAKQEGRIRHLRGFMLDITGEQGTEATLRKSEERLHLALDAASMGVWDWNIVTSEIYWSDQIYRLHGFTKDEFDGSYESFLRVIDRVHPDDADVAQETIRRALSTREDYGIEYRINFPDERIQWLYAKGCIYFGENGDPVRIAGTVQDITARKQAEAALIKLTETLEQRVRERTVDLERVNVALKQENRERRRAEQVLEKTNMALLQSNRELQDFAYVASHDLQEPLRKISTFADLLRSDYEAQLDAPAISYIERMMSAAERMRHLIRDLLEFSRIKTKPQPFQETDLNKVVHNVLIDLEVRIKESGGRVDVEELPSIEVDPMQMHQLFQNLLGNALKFRRKEVPPVVKLRAVAETDEYAVEVCRITIEDNGIGFEEQYIDRIFSPFQRLHARTEYEGTGMGLAICRRIVERHHGTITARSIPGRGTTFTVVLPVRQERKDDAVAGLDEA
jgi:PAS domain S-box-containing protein